MTVALLGNRVVYVRWLKIGGVKNPGTNEGGEYMIETRGAGGRYQILSKAHYGMLAEILHLGWRTSQSHGELRRVAARRCLQVKTIGGVGP